MPRLRRSHYPGPGIVRLRRGRGFSYRWSSGDPVHETEILERIAHLAIPPAWNEVWICPWPNGHLQAVGTDAAGRRQYRYHEDWRRRRDAEKFDRMLLFAAALPQLRVAVSTHLAGQGLGRERVLAAAVRLLDVGLFRVGGEEYAEEHETYGVATLLREHVRFARGEITFDYVAKSGKQRRLAVRDAELEPVLRALKARRGGGPELLAWREGRRWHDVRSGDVNDYLKAQADAQFSAKDFRTWSATVLAAAELAAIAARPLRRRGDTSATSTPSRASQSRAVRAAMCAVAEQLGNTPAVCRSSYVDPRVIERFEVGETLRLAATGPVRGAGRDAGNLRAGVAAAAGAGEAADPWQSRRELEALVLELLAGHGGVAGSPAAPARRRRAA